MSDTIVDRVWLFCPDPAIGRLREMDGVSLSALDREPRRVDARVESSE
jgi:hypothetical protein